jgi:hypothetical protein
MIQGNLKKISGAMAMFRAWALDKGLKPSETQYVRSGRGGTVNLRFSKSGDPGIERNYRTHYVSPALSERKQERLAQKLNEPAKPVVFEILRESACSECGAELERGSFLLIEAERPLCLPCARLGDLEYLPAGDTVLTRRSARYSERTAVVVRFSRSRGRYERQGVLVEKAAYCAALPVATLFTNPRRRLTLAPAREMTTCAKRRLSILARAVSCPEETS